MESTQATVEPITVSEVLDLATWDRPRSDDELRAFIQKRQAVVDNL